MKGDASTDKYTTNKAGIAEKIFKHKEIKISCILLTCNSSATSHRFEVYSKGCQIFSFLKKNFLSIFWSLFPIDYKDVTPMVSNTLSYHTSVKKWCIYD